ncbi:HNH endonuclease [Comamonas sp. MYb396]|uniref:HNH endonuclease n=1 Tax=Comamonas sp. MYb396 TaxID=2745302 RepID=UPI0030B2CCFF
MAIHFSKMFSATKRASSGDWSDEELQATVASYAEMMQFDAEGTPYVKAHYYRDLSTRFGRVEGAFERRMQNISYLLESQGLERLRGLKPQRNVGANVQPRLKGFLDGVFGELSTPLRFAEELVDTAGVIEGVKKQVTVNAYERDSTAKRRCIKRWGCTCAACGFDFHKVYGDLGKGFIHVHHLKPIHTLGGSYLLDPENDLRPVCPNCHSMLHRKTEVLSIEDLRNILARERQN